MLIAAVLAITLDPALRLLFTRLRRFSFRPAILCRVTNAVLVGTIRDEATHPVSRVLHRLYEPVVTWALRRRWFVIGGTVAMLLVTIPVFRQLGSEFMPPLDEGSLLYMRRRCRASRSARRRSSCAAPTRSSSASRGGPRARKAGRAETRPTPRRSPCSRR